MSAFWRRAVVPASAWIRRCVAPATVAPSSAQPCNVARLRCVDAAVFFGYHDKTPFDAHGSRVLAHCVRADDALADSEGTPAEVGYFTLAGSHAPAFMPLARTTAWSWQQGSMLQWDPADPARRVVFNVLEGVAAAVVHDMEVGRTVERLPRPVYAMSTTGAWVVSLNFARLARLRPGYGHARARDTNANDPAPADDGVFLVERANGRVSLLASLRDLAHHGSQAPSEAHHYVNHASFSPDESRVAFFHLWHDDAGRKTIRFYVADRATGERRLIEGGRFVSHYCWLDADRLLVTTRDHALQWRYSVYDARTGAREDVPIAIGFDGHPMRSPRDPHLVVSDTTPDVRRRQHLLLIDLERPGVVELGAWRASERYRGRVRCDLHPRWDRQGTRICVDSAHEGRREMLVITLPQMC